MEINIIEKDERENYIVSVGGKFTITTTLVEQHRADRGREKEWFREINKIYGKKGKNNLIVGLRGDKGLNYVGGRCYWRNPVKKDEDEPFDVLQLCVGYHCLLYFPGCNDSKAIKDFFGDRRNTFVGVGIEKTAKKIEKFMDGCLVQSRVELKELAAEKGYILHVKDDDQKGRCSLSKLAKVVLGEEVDFVKPRKNIEWDSEDWYKYATTEAFLASQIGAKLLKSKCYSN